MDLTPAKKQYIDSLPYADLLHHVRFVPVGDPIFQGETGAYWLQRMKELRAQPGGQEEHVRESKAMGW
jgi:hypothetical protein